MDPNTLIVWAMNGQPLPNIHGGPVRLIVPGWPGSASQKWLTRICVRDKEHDGPGMTEFSYRVAIKPMVPGDKGDPANFRILESMPVRSIITNPANGAKLAAGTKELKLRGASWAGDLTVKQVDISTDFGATLADRQRSKSRRTNTTGSAGPRRVKLPSDGYYEIWARATDSKGAMQPHQAGSWNPQGYGGNADAPHRGAGRVDACASPCAGDGGSCCGRRPRSRKRPSRRATKARKNSPPAPAATKPSMPAPPATTSSWWRRKA